MADWENNGTVRDLSHLAENSMTATSQAAGNMMSSNAQAMTAPGSQPVTPLPPTRDQDVPDLTMSPEIPVSYTGKPDPTKQSGPPGQPRPRWTRTAIPDVTRTPAPAPPDPAGDATEASIGVSGPARGATSGRAAAAAAASTATEGG